jgi:hypothetical protein
MTDVSIFDRDLPASTDYSAITDLLDELYPEYDRRALAGVARQLAGQLDDAIPAMPVVREATARWLQGEGIVPFAIMYAVPYRSSDGAGLVATVDIRVTRAVTRTVAVHLSQRAWSAHWHADRIEELTQPS